MIELVMFLVGSLVVSLIFIGAILVRGSRRGEKTKVATEKPKDEVKEEKKPEKASPETKEEKKKEVELKLPTWLKWLVIVLVGAGAFLWVLYNLGILPDSSAALAAGKSYGSYLLSTEQWIPIAILVAGAIWGLQHASGGTKWLTRGAILICIIWASMNYFGVTKDDLKSRFKSSESATHAPAAQPSAPQVTTTEVFVAFGQAFSFKGCKVFFDSGNGEYYRMFFKNPTYSDEWVPQVPGQMPKGTVIMPMDIKSGLKGITVRREC